MDKKFYINGRFLTQKVSGIQRMARSLTIEILKINKNFIVLVPEAIDNKIINGDYIKVVPGLKGHLWEQITLPLFLHKINCPLLINFSPTAPLFYKNNILTICDLSHTHLEWVTKRFYFFYNFLISRLVKKAMHIFTISNFSKKKILEHYNLDNSFVSVIHLALSDNFKKVSEQKNIINKKKYILGVSSINKRKNFDSLIQAFLRISPAGYKLIIVGEKNTKVFKNFNLSDKSERIIFLKNIDDNKLIKLYSESTMFVYPSLLEGFGLPPLEAMACGCPTLVSNNSSLPEVCQDAALYCDPFNIDSIEEQMKKILKDNDLQKKLVIRGYKQITKFSYKKSANLILKKILNIDTSF